jgi:hypothetical protein
MLPTARSFPNLIYQKSAALLWIFGGFDGNLYQNDLFCYNVSTGLWVTLTNVYGIKPGPRYSAGAVIYGMSVLSLVMAIAGRYTRCQHDDIAVCVLSYYFSYLQVHHYTYLEA